MPNSILLFCVYTYVYISKVMGSIMYMHTHHILFARSSVEGQQFRNAVLFLFIEPTPSPSRVSRVPGSRTLSLPVLRGVRVLLRLIRRFITCRTSSGAT